VQALLVGVGHHRRLGEHGSVEALEEGDIDAALGRGAIGIGHVRIPVSQLERLRRRAGMKCRRSSALIAAGLSADAPAD
jgi:hypothetical protein